MCTKENRKLEIRKGDVKITVEGPSEVFGGHDLKLKAICTLINQLDFKFGEDRYMQVRDQYYLAVLTSLGKFMMNDHPSNPEETTPPTPIQIVHAYIDWRHSPWFLERRPDLQEFIAQYVS